MKKIAILGGTFDPIHLAHLKMAEYVYATGNYDEILFIPTGHPPHKGDDYKITDKEHRWNMCILAILPYPNYNISIIELQEDKINYSVNTLEKLKKLNPDYHYSLIIGADSLFDLDKWHKPNLFHELCDFIVINRPGYENEIFNQIDIIKNKYKIEIELVEMPLMDISSSMIRKNILENKPINNMVPSMILDYIKSNNLYQKNQITSDYYLNIKEIETKLEKNLSKKRFLHSISTKNTAIELAMHYNYNVYKAALAGLLHDCARDISTEEKLNLCKTNNIILTQAETNNPDLLHAKLGAIIAKKIYNVNDKEILDAITCHTTGKPNMTLLDKIIYIADYIEPNRMKFNNIDFIRKLTKTSLDKALIEILKNTLNYLNGKKKTIDTKTLETFMFYNEKNQRKENNMEKSPLKMLDITYKALNDKQAVDIKILDIKEVTVMADYFVIAHGNNPNHIKSLIDNVEEQLSKEGYLPKNIEGYNSESWILLDYGEVIIHIFSKDDRFFYNLEKIWAAGKEIFLD